MSKVMSREVSDAFWEKVSPLVPTPERDPNKFTDVNLAAVESRWSTGKSLKLLCTKQRGEEIQEKKDNPKFKCRRWIVDVAHSWCNRFRKLLVRYEKLTNTYEALLHMATAIIAFRKAGVIYG